jgi:hypothetical protein
MGLVAEMVQMLWLILVLGEVVLANRLVVLVPKLVGMVVQE